MTTALLAIAVVGGIVLLVGEWVWRRRRRPTNLGSGVTRRWLNDHEYEKDGDAS